MADDRTPPESRGGSGGFKGQSRAVFGPAGSTGELERPEDPIGSHEKRRELLRWELCALQEQHHSRSPHVQDDESEPLSAVEGVGIGRGVPATLGAERYEQVAGCADRPAVDLPPGKSCERDTRRIPIDRFTSRRTNSCEDRGDGRRRTERGLDRDHPPRVVYREPAECYPAERRPSIRAPRCPLGPSPRAVGRGDPDSDRKRSRLVSHPGGNRTLRVKCLHRLSNGVRCRSSPRPRVRRKPGRIGWSAAGQSWGQDACGCRQGTSGLGLSTQRQVDRCRGSRHEERYAGREECALPGATTTAHERGFSPGRRRDTRATPRILDLDNGCGSLLSPAQDPCGAFRARDSVEGLRVRRHEDPKAIVVRPPTDRTLEHRCSTYPWRRTTMTA